MLETLAQIPIAELLFYAWLLWALTAVLAMLAERRSPVATLAWTLALLLLPFVGAVVYIAFGPRRLQRRRLRYLAASDAVVRAAVQQLHATRSTTPFEERTACRQLATLMNRVGEGLPVRAERIDMYPEGDAAFAAIEAAIRDARDHVHLEFYIWEPDALGQHLRDLLCERARAGVSVRVLVDGVGSARLGRAFWAPLRAAGGQVAWFNAFRLLHWRPHLFNFRTHRKLIVCDGSVGFTGGVNVSACQSAHLSGRDACRDTHIRIVGEPVRKLQRIFLEDWFFANPRRRAVRDDIVRFFPDLRGAAGPWTQIIASGPDDDRAAIHKFYFAAINAAIRRVWLTTPYFVPDEAMIAALTTAALRGVDVQLLVPRKGDSRLVTAASRSYYDQMASADIQVHEYEARMLHAKTMVVDDDIAVVGTANIDNRSFRLNFEMIAAIFDPGVAGEAARQFEADLEFARRRRKPSRKHLRRLSTLYDRFLESLARLFSPVL